MAARSRNYFHLLSICALVFVGLYSHSAKVFATPCIANLSLPSDDNFGVSMPCTDGSGGTTGGGPGPAPTPIGDATGSSSEYKNQDPDQSCNSPVDTRAAAATQIADDMMIPAQSTLQIRLGDGNLDIWWVNRSSTGRHLRLSNTSCGHT